jgi:hypothetical protein
VTSEISNLLEPIPEEDLAPNGDGSDIYAKKLEMMRNAKAAAR